MVAETNGHAERVLDARMKEAVVNALETRTMISRQLYGQSIDRRRDINHECGYPATGSVTIEQLQDFYDREPVAARVVELFPKECWKVEPLVYEEEDSETVTPFETSWDELGKSLRGIGWHEQEAGSIVWEYLQRLDVQCGIGNYGVLLLGFDDGLDLSMPVKGVEEAGSAARSKEMPNPSVNEVYRLTVNAKAIKGRKLLYVRVFPQVLAQVTQWEANPSSLRFGQPIMYQLTFNDPTQSLSVSNPMGSTRNVHWTRIIHVADNLGSSEVLGVPRMLPVLNPIYDVQKVRAADGEAFWKGAFLQIYLEMLPEFADVPRDAESLRNMMEAMMNSGQRYGALEGYSAKSIPPAVVDPTSHFDTPIRAICIKLAVPQRIFEGSERGELASSQDADSWESRLKGRRNGFVTPRIIAPFVNRLIMVGVLQAPAESYCVEWPEAEVLTPLEKAQITATRTQALSAYIGGGCEAVVTPMDYLTRYDHFTEEEATAMLEAAEEQALEDEEADIEQQKRMIDEGLAPDPTDPGPQLPIKMKDGEKLVMPDGNPLPPGRK